MVAAVEKMAALEQAGADAATLAALYVDAFIRLMNDGDFAQAQQLAQGEGVERRLRHCTAPARQDVLIALLLKLHPGGAAWPASSGCGMGLSNSRRPAKSLNSCSGRPCAARKRPSCWKRSWPPIPARRMICASKLRNRTARLR